MKRNIGLGLALSLLLAVLALGVSQVGKAAAGAPTPTPEGQSPVVDAMGHGHGVLAPYMEQAMAKAFGLTTDELEALHQSGASLWEYATQQGLSADEIRAKMEQAREEAIQAALADGVITEQQAEWLQNRTPGKRLFGAPHGHGRGGCADGQNFAPRGKGMPGYGQGNFDSQGPEGSSTPNAQPTP